MPKIKLKQDRGSYGFGNLDFEANRVYEVDYPVANCLVNQEKVAVLVQEVESPPQEKIVPKETQAPSIIPNDNLVKIAVVRIGGIGDSLITAGFAVAVKRKYPNSHITLYIRDRESRDFVVDNPGVNHVVIVGNKVIENLVENVILKKGYDIVYDIRYMTKTYYADEKRFAEERAKTDALLAPYQEYFDAYPHRNNELWHKYKINSYDFMLLTTGLQGSPDDMEIVLEEQDKNMLILLEGDKYITVHNGADLSRQTKCWPAENWNELIPKLKEQGYKIIQLGANLEEPIKGAIYLNGKTTLKQSAALISGAQFHIDSEGGLVHIARAECIRSIVLFGPTNYDFFKYGENVNVVTSNECKDCWWSDDMWWRECPKKYPLPAPCMKAITPKDVLEAVEKIELFPRPFKKVYKNNEIVEPKIKEPEKSKSPFNDEEYYKKNPAELDRLVTIGAKVTGNKVLIINGGKHALILAERLKARGYNITCVENEIATVEGLKASGFICNPPKLEDGSFDVVIYDDVKLTSIILKGFEQMIKPGGKIIYSMPFSEGYSMVFKDGKMDYIIIERIK